MHTILENRQVVLHELRLTQVFHKETMKKQRQINIEVLLLQVFHKGTMKKVYIGVLNLKYL